MGEEIKKTGNEALQRWNKKMPKFFQRIMTICGLISGTVIVVNTALNTYGVQPHQWWIDICPYLLGVPIGMGFACKFTVDGGFRNKSMEKYHQNTILDKDDN